jgi:hypothetical protein
VTASPREMAATTSEITRTLSTLLAFVVIIVRLCCLLV